MSTLNTVVKSVLNSKPAIVAQEIGSTLFKGMVDVYKGQNPNTEKTFMIAICQLVSIQLLNAGYEKFIFKKIEDKGWNKTANALRSYNKANTYLGIGLVGLQYAARLEAAKSLAADKLIMSDKDIEIAVREGIDEADVPAHIRLQMQADKIRKEMSN